MTKERRLAIEMWEGIKESIQQEETDTINPPVNLLKKIFTRDHKLEWFNNCWFCQYFNCAINCPLYKKDSKHFAEVEGCVDFWIAANYTSGAIPKYLNREGLFKKKERIAACDRIIKVLKGEE